MKDRLIVTAAAVGLAGLVGSAVEGLNQNTSPSYEVKAMGTRRSPDYTLGAGCYLLPDAVHVEVDIWRAGGRTDIRGENTLYNENVVFIPKNDSGRSDRYLVDTREGGGAAVWTWDLRERIDAVTEDIARHLFDRGPDQEGRRVTIGHVSTGLLERQGLFDRAPFPSPRGLRQPIPSKGCRPW